MLLDYRRVERGRILRIEGAPMRRLSAHFGIRRGAIPLSREWRRSGCSQGAPYLDGPDLVHPLLSWARALAKPAYRRLQTLACPCRRRYWTLRSHCDREDMNVDEIPGLIAITVVFLYSVALLFALILGFFAFFGHAKERAKAREIDAELARIRAQPSAKERPDATTRSN